MCATKSHLGTIKRNTLQKFVVIGSPEPWSGHMQLIYIMLLVPRGDDTWDKYACVCRLHCDAVRVQTE